MKKLIFVLSLLSLSANGAWAQSASGGSGTAKTIGYASAGIATGMGGYLVRQNCGNPSTMMLCMMGVMSLLQGVQSLAAAGGSGGTEAATTSDCTTNATSFNCMNSPGGGGPGGGGPGAGTGGVGGFGSGLPPDQQAAINTAAAQGYKYNPGSNTVTTPKGTFPAAAFASGSTMADAGIIPKDQAAAIDKSLADALSKAGKGLMAGSGVGGGGANGGGVKIEYTDDGGGAGGKGRLGQMGQPKTAGLTRTLASGEAIGAQVDDIFRMITAKYQQKSAEKIFVGQQ